MKVRGFIQQLFYKYFSVVRSDPNPFANIKTIFGIKKFIFII